MPDFSPVARILTLMRVLADEHMDRDISSLASFIGTSTKTIRRDIAELKSQGIVISERSESNNRKVYSIDKSTLPPLKLTFDEALAIVFGTKTLSGFEGTGLEEAARSAISKIRTFLGEPESQYLDKVLPRIHASKKYEAFCKNRSVVDELMVALEDERAIFIEYASAKSTEPLTYDIYPYGMSEHKGALYVVGYSCHHSEVRTWKVDRILDAELTLFPFKRPGDFDLANYLSTAFGVVSGDDLHSIKIRFTGSAVRYVCERKYHPSQQYEQQLDGSVIVTVELSSLLEIKSWVFSFGSSAEVIQPLELRHGIEEEIRQLQEVYGNSTNQRPHSSVGRKE